jgi:hypothetical protein
MKQFQTQALIDRLKAETRQIILQTDYLLKEDPEILTTQPAEGKWSVVQVIEHLNSYGRYYLPLIRSSLDTGDYTPSAHFKPGWLGDYFTRSMLPKQGNRVTNKMQSPKDHRPGPDLDSKTVIDEFLQQEHTLLQLLENAGNNNIGKIRIPISIARFIRLKLGDTFRFLVAHHQRHFVQVQNTLKLVKTAAVNLSEQV